MSKLKDFPVYSAKTKKRVLRGIVASTIVVIIVMAYLLNVASGPVFTSNKIMTEVTISVVRDGQLINEVTKEDDMILENFGWFIYEHQLQPPLVAGGNTWDPKDATGVTVSIQVWNTTSSYTIADTTEGDVGVFFMIGSNATAPSWDDYTIIPITMDPTMMFATAFQTHTDGFSISTQGVVDEVAPDDIDEVGMGGLWLDTSGDLKPVLLCRDVVSAISIAEFDLITISYRFIFSTGYTQNFMTFLLYVLYGADEDESSSIFLVDTAGETQQLNIYRATPSASWYGYCTAYPTNYGAWIALGNGATAFDKDQYGLQGAGILTTWAVTHQPTEPENVMHAYFIPTSAMTAYEAGIYRASETVNGMKYIMFARLTFAAKPIGAGITAKVEFTEEF